MRLLTRFALCAGLLFLASTCFAQQSYNITDLGGLSPTDINNSTQVVGDLNGHAYLWTASTGLTDLGLLPSGTFSRAAAINDLGVVTGTADGFGNVSGAPSDCSGTFLTQPFVWSPGTGMQGLGILWGPGFSLYSELNDYIACPAIPFHATGINEAGRVIGYTDQIVAWYQWNITWDVSTGMQYFGGTYAPNWANGINNTGQIVGAYGLYGISPLATSWKDGTMTQLMPTPSGSDMFTGSIANSVNDLGLVAGWYQGTDAVRHASLWTSTGMLRDLGTLPGDLVSAALEVNIFGEVIGTSGTTSVARWPWTPNGSVSGRQFIWTDSGGMKDLSTLIPSGSGWTLTSVTGINGRGEIVGQGTIGGEQHGYLLTPVYRGLVQSPLKADGTSVFSLKRGTVPLKFSLSDALGQTCQLSEATISFTRIAGGTLGPVADGGSTLRIDPIVCQYIYHLDPSSLGPGTYQVHLSIGGVMVGHSVFSLK